MENASLYYLIGGLVLVGILTLLYKRFYVEQDSGGEDELKWVNKSNYNIATSESTAEVMENATPAEAREIVHKMTDSDDAIPPSEQEFFDLNEKTGGAGDTDDVKDKLSHPNA